MVDATDGQTQRTASLHDLVPQEWVPAEDSQLWTAAYRVLRAPATAFPPDPSVFDFGDVRAWLFWGSLHYFDTAAMRVSLLDADQLHIDRTDATEKDAPQGRYVLFLTPYSGDNSDEPRARAAIATARGLMVALNGRNIAWDCVFENIALRGQLTGFSPDAEIPLAYRVPDLTAHGIERLARLAAMYRGSPEPTRARLALSLRWLEAATRESGVDAVLKYWVALETLAMQDPNVRPVNESLKRAYQMSFGEVQAKFGVGRVQELRSRIVHKGALVPIHQDLLKYLEALYTDVLLEHLGQPPERLALAVLATPGFDLRALLHQ